MLREAFGYPYAEIGAVLDRSEAAVRQLAGRARRHVEERRPRFDTDPSDTARITERFLAACLGGDLPGLLAMLAPDVRLVGDGGGLQKAPRRVIESADKVGRFLRSIAGRSVPEPGFSFREINGAPAVVVTSRGRPHTVFALEVTGGLVTTVYILTNPQKLDGVAPRTTVSRPAGSDPSKET